MPRTFKERPRLAAVGITAALLLAAVGAMAGAGLASGDGGMPAEAVAALERAETKERHTVRGLRSTRAALGHAQEEARAERRRARGLGRKARGLQRSNRALRRALHRERRR